MNESVDSLSRVLPPASGNAAPHEPPGATRPNGRAVTRADLSPEDILAIEHMVTEDDTPVDNWFSEQQQRLLTHPLYASWPGPGEGRPFVVAANVGVFRLPREAPLVPDAFLCLNVSRPKDYWAKPGRSYCMWEYDGKPPDVVIEVVSNTEGGEMGAKKERYAQFGVTYYVVFDPRDHLKQGRLHAFELSSTGIYVECQADLLPMVGLGLRLWRGVFEKEEATWLRWHDASGALIPTAEERAEQERNRAEKADNRAEQADNRAKQERNRAKQADNRAKQERNRAEQADNRAKQERNRAEQADNRAKQERNRAEKADNRAEQERNRADQERDGADRLAALLRAHGIPSDDGGNPDESGALPD